MENSLDKTGKNVKKIVFLILKLITGISFFCISVYFTLSLLDFPMSLDALENGIVRSSEFLVFFAIMVSMLNLPGFLWLNKFLSVRKNRIILFFWKSIKFVFMFCSGFLYCVFCYFFFPLIWSNIPFLLLFIALSVYLLLPIGIFINKRIRKSNNKTLKLIKEIVIWVSGAGMAAIYIIVWFLYVDEKGDDLINLIFLSFFTIGPLSPWIYALGNRLKTKFKILDKLYIHIIIHVIFTGFIIWGALLLISYFSSLENLFSWLFSVDELFIPLLFVIVFLVLFSPLLYLLDRKIKKSSKQIMNKRWNMIKACSYVLRMLIILMLILLNIHGHLTWDADSLSDVFMNWTGFELNEEIFFVFIIVTLYLLLPLIFYINKRIRESENKTFTLIKEIAVWLSGAGMAISCIGLWSLYLKNSIVDVKILVLLFLITIGPLFPCVYALGNRIKTKLQLFDKDYIYIIINLLFICIAVWSAVLFVSSFGSSGELFSRIFNVDLVFLLFIGIVFLVLFSPLIYFIGRKIKANKIQIGYGKWNYIKMFLYAARVLILLIFFLFNVQGHFSRGIDFVKDQLRSKAGKERYIEIFNNYKNLEATGSQILDGIYADADVKYNETLVEALFLKAAVAHQPFVRNLINGHVDEETIMLLKSYQDNTPFNIGDNLKHVEKEGYEDHPYSTVLSYQELIDALKTLSLIRIYTGMAQNNILPVYEMNYNLFFSRLKNIDSEEFENVIIREYPGIMRNISVRVAYEKQLEMYTNIYKFLLPLDLEKVLPAPVLKEVTFLNNMTEHEYGMIYQPLYERINAENYFIYESYLFWQIEESFKNTMEAVFGRNSTYAIQKLTGIKGNVEYQYGEIYNPDVIRWISNKMIPRPDMKINNVYYRDLYEKMKFAARLYGAVYVQMMEMGEIDWLFEEFERTVVHGDVDCWRFVNDNFGILYEQISNNIPELYSQIELETLDERSGRYIEGSVSEITGFWLRRMNHENDDELFVFLGAVYSKYDPEWYDCLIDRFR